MANTNIQKLIEINERIKGLKAVKCGIAHEKVHIDNITNLPVSNYTGEIVYERVGFCSKDLRNERISCSHSMASYILEDALNLLDTESEKIIYLKNNLKDVMFQIYQLDIKKGEAEKRLAILIEKNVNETDEVSEADIKMAREEIEKIKNEHDGRVDEIAEVRNRTVAEIESVIN